MLQMTGITLFGLKYKYIAFRLKGTEVLGYDAKVDAQIDDLTLRLCDDSEALKPERKKKIPFESVEIRAICQCLMERRNREIQAKRYGAVDALNELLIQFSC